MIQDPFLFGRSSDDLESPSTTKESPSDRKIEYQNPHEQSESYVTARRESLPAAERARRNLNAKLTNPLAGLSHAALMKRGGRYARRHMIGDEEDIRAFELGAVLAQDPQKYESVQGLLPEELEALRKEFTNRWSQPKLMYLVIVLCSMCAAVQGMGKFT